MSINPIKPLFNLIFWASHFSIFGKIAGALFGTGDKSKTEQHATLSPEQLEIQSLLSEYLQDSGSPEGFEGFQGELVSGPTDIEQMSLTALEQRSQQLATGGDPNLAAAAEALTGILSRDSTDINEFFNTNVKDPLLESFNEDIRPAISSRFSDQFFGSDRKNADMRANEDLIETLGRERSRTAFEARQFDTQAILEAAGLMPSVTGAGTQELLQILDAGSLERDIEDRRLSGEFEKFVTNEQLQQGRTGNLLDFLTPGNVENITTVKRGKKGLLSSFAEGAGAGAGQALVL